MWPNYPQSVHSFHSLAISLTFGFQSEVEETLKRIQGHKGVIGVIVVNQEGKKDTKLAWWALIGKNTINFTQSSPNTIFQCFMMG